MRIPPLLRSLVTVIVAAATPGLVLGHCRSLAAEPRPFTGERSPGQARSAASTAADAPIAIRLRATLDRPPYAGEWFDLDVVVDFDTSWADDSLVQLFPQELDRPLQIDALRSIGRQLEVQLLPEPGSGPTIVLNEAVRTVAEEEGPVGRTALVVKARARFDRAAALSLPTPRVSYSSASSFRDDFVRGRVPVNTAPGSAVGSPMDLRSVPLPEAGRPPEFAGAIGAFELEQSAVQSKARVGEPFAVDVVVTNGARLPEGVRPTIDLDHSVLRLIGVTAQDVEGQADDKVLRFEFVANGTELVAWKPGLVEVAAARLATFDPTRGAYAWVISEPVSVYIAPAARSTGDAPALAQTPPADAGDRESSDRESSDGNSNDAAPDAPNLRWTTAVIGLVCLLAVVSAVRRIHLRQRTRGTSTFGIRHVAFVTKYAANGASGNVVAIDALAERFERRGIRSTFIGPEGVFDRASGGTDSHSSPYDIVHAFHGGAPTTLAAGIARDNDCPFVVTVTGTDLEGSSEAADVAALRQAAVIIALTAEQAERLERMELGVPVHLSPQAIDFDPASVEPLDARERFGLAEDARIAVMLGGLRPVKGQGLAIDAFRTLGSRRSESADRWHLVILGDDLDPGYSADVRSHGLSNVTLGGAVPRETALGLLRSADAIVNASVSEGESRAILEAQALGVPVVARRNPGNVALIGADERGLGFDDAQGLADALERLVWDDAIRPTIVGQAQRVVHERPTLNDEASMTLRTYAVALRNRSPERTDHDLPTAADRA